MSFSNDINLKENQYAITDKRVGGGGDEEIFQMRMSSTGYLVLKKDDKYKVIDFDVDDPFPPEIRQDIPSNQFTIVTNFPNSIACLSRNHRTETDQDVTIKAKINDNIEIPEGYSYRIYIRMAATYYYHSATTGTTYRNTLSHLFLIEEINNTYSYTFPRYTVMFSNWDSSFSISVSRESTNNSAYFMIGKDKNPFID